MSFLLYNKKILTSLLASCTLLAGTHTAAAQDSGILELSIRRPWQISASKRAACIVTAELTKQHRLQIAFDGETKNTSILLLTDNDQFIVNRLYQSDIYVDFNTQFTNNAVPINARDIELVTMDTGRFMKLFNSIQELSFGLDDTLYVLNVANIPFPIDGFDRCVQAKMPKDRGVLDTIASLNPFSLPDDIKNSSNKRRLTKIEKDPEFAELDAMIDQVQNLDASTAQPKKWRPFLTSYRPEPYSLQPAPKTAQNLTRESASNRKDVAMPKDQHYNGLLERQDQSALGAAESCGAGPGPDGVYEFSQIPEAELPPQMQGLRDFMTGNNNQNEEKELIKSLLVQLELLEKEKEALRRRSPESLEALSVIRSCKREEGVIDDLRGQLQQSENDKFDLLKQREIDGDVFDMYDDIDDQAALSPPPEDVPDTGGPLGEPDNNDDVQASAPAPADDNDIDEPVAVDEAEISPAAQDDNAADDSAPTTLLPEPGDDVSISGDDTDSDNALDDLVDEDFLKLLEAQ